jgi:hypothetical protein
MIEISASEIPLSLLARTFIGFCTGAIDKGEAGTCRLSNRFCANVSTSKKRGVKIFLK